MIIQNRSTSRDYPPGVTITHTGASNRTLTDGGATAGVVIAGGQVHVLCPCGRYVDDVRQAPGEPDVWVCFCEREWIVDATVREATTE